MAKVIFHIDINAFFASAHRIENPALVGKPVVVCSNHRGSVVTTASYEARRFGIHSAMPLSQAKKLCDELVIVNLDFSLYQDLSAQFMNIIRSYSPLIQAGSIDECYVDMTEAIKRYKHPLDLAKSIQARVAETLLLPISIGIAPNKFLAKMASDMNKPNGITVLRIREVKQKLWPLAIDAMHGIGKKTVPQLKRKGVHTIGDLAQVNPMKIQNILGINTQSMINRANGHDNADIITENETKSIGQSKTYTTPLLEIEEIKQAIWIELNEVMRRLQKEGYVGRTLTFSLRLENYRTASRSITSETYFDKADEIFERIMQFYDEFEGEGAISFLSVTISNLVDKADLVNQISIFDPIDTRSTDSIIRDLNHLFKDNPVFKKASSLVGDKHGK